MNEAELLDALALRYAPPEFAFIRHVRRSTGAYNCRTIDAVAMNLYPSRGLDLHGFEVKVSRGDWMREMREPDKAEEIAPYCSRFWAVVAEREIVQEGELPPTWGLLAPRGGKLVAVKDAPVLVAKEPDRRLLAAILRRAAADISVDGVIAKARASGFEEGKKEGRDDRKREAEHWQRQHDEILRRVMEFERISGIDISRAWRLGNVANAVRILAGTDEDLRRDLAGIQKRIARIAEGLAEAIAIIPSAFPADPAPETEELDA